MKRNSRLVLRSSLAFLLIGFIGCSQPRVETPSAARPVKIHTIGSLEPASIREYPGTIRAYQTAEMGFEVSGRVTEFLVLEGQDVEKDQVLARLDARDYQAELKVAQANLDKAQADFTRSTNIQKTNPGAVSQDTIESDKRSVQVAEAKLEIASKAVEDTELRAPFAGVMARKLVEDFANVLAKETVMIVQDNSTLEIEVAVPERDFVQRRPEDETPDEVSKRIDPKVILSALPDREFPARIKEYATQADPITRTFPVKLNFDNPPELNILPGMTARVRVVINPESAWSVPVTAAQSDANQQAYVWKVDPGNMQVHKAPVQLGPLTGSRVLLKGGVEEGDMVAISGVMQLTDGMQVRKFDE